MALSKMQLSQLLNTYSAMLTEKQKEAVVMYCDCDCSLSEIADEVGVSRQGVRDAIVNAEKTLVRLEASLHFSEFLSELVPAVENDDAEAVKNIVKGFLAKE